MSAGLPIWIGLYIPHTYPRYGFKFVCLSSSTLLRLLPPSSTGENDSFVCILAGCCESVRAGKTRRVKLTIDYTERKTESLWYGFKRWRVAAELPLIDPIIQKTKHKKSIGEQHRSRELNVGQTNPDEPEEIFYGTRQHFVLYPSHPTRRLFTASKYGKRGGGLVTHWRHNLLPPAEPSGLVPVVFASLSFSHLSSFSFFFFFSVLVILSLFFLFSPLGLASAAKSTSGITASSSFFFFCVLVSWFSFSLCFISPGLRSQRTYSAQLVNDCRSKCTGDLLPSDTTRATTPVNISTNSGKPPLAPSSSSSSWNVVQM